MTPEIKQKWAEALRSGRYTQCHGVLRNGNKFCALGVLCDILVSNGIGCWRGNSFSYNERSWIATYPENVKQAEVEWNVVDNIIVLNDGHMASFLKIAKWIEEDDRI